jgi:hypothetical protein
MNTFSNLLYVVWMGMIVVELQEQLKLGLSLRIDSKWMIPSLFKLMGAFLLSMAMLLPGALAPYLLFELLEPWDQGPIPPQWSPRQIQGQCNRRELLYVH